MLKVLKFPDPFLFKVAKPVTHFDQALQERAEQMVHTMYAYRGVGLAATQVGFDARVFVMDCNDTKGTSPFIFVNPNILSVSSEKNMHQEGCLSFPSLYVPVERPTTVHLRWQDTQGAFHEQTFSGLEAICVQHEIDHLQGIVFLKHLSSAQRNKALRTLEKLQKQKTA